jgi:hypothetical protein
MGNGNKKQVFNEGRIMPPGTRIAIVRSVIDCKFRSTNMNRAQITFALALCLGAGVTRGIQAQPSNASGLRGSLHRIEANARAARDNAAIYQWKRVNYEVDRIVAAEHAVEKVLASDAGQKERVAALHEAVGELRKARLNHDVDQIKVSTDRVLNAADTLQKANG